MEEKKIELLGMNVEPRKFWDILFFCAVRMEIETEAYGTTEERKQWLRNNIKLSEELMIYRSKTDSLPHGGRE